MSEPQSSPPSSQLQIFITPPSSTAVSLLTSPSSTILQLKKEIQNDFEYNFEDFSLSLNGKALNDEKTLEELGIKNDQSIQMLMRIRGGASNPPFEIRVY